MFLLTSYEFCLLYYTGQTLWKIHANHCKYNRLFIQFVWVIQKFHLFHPCDKASVVIMADNCSCFVNLLQLSKQHHIKYWIWKALLGESPVISTNSGFCYQNTHTHLQESPKNSFSILASIPHLHPYSNSRFKLWIFCRACRFTPHTKFHRNRSEGSWRKFGNFFFPF